MKILWAKRTRLQVLRDPINDTSQSLGQGDSSGDGEKQMGLRYAVKVIMTSVMIAWMWKMQERG